MHSSPLYMPSYALDDFCNSAMFGINLYLLDRLQSILNAAAWIILQIPKFSSISSAIRDEMHWLPVWSLIILSTVSSSVAALLAQLHPNYPSSVFQFLPLLDVKACARLPKVPSWYLGSGQNGTVDGVSPCQDHKSGTYCCQEFALLLRSLISSREFLNII